MPQVLGPYSLSSTPPLVLNTAVAIQIDRSARAIQVHNDSPYLLYLAFDGQQPTALASMHGEYDASVGPWGHPVIPIQRTAASARERMLNAISDFTGTLWVMTIDPTGKLAQTGSVSQLNMVHLDVLLPGEAWPQAWAVPRQHDLTSQPRVVCVPMGLSHFNTGQWAVGDPSPLVLQTANISPAQLAAGTAPIYLYYAQIYATSSTTNAMAFNLEVQWRTAGGVALGGPFVMARGAVLDNVTNQTTAPWVFAPAWPFAAVGPFPATAAKADLQLTFISGSRMTVHYTVAFWMDPTNTVGDADIGVQALFNPASSPLF